MNTAAPAIAAGRRLWVGIPGLRLTAAVRAHLERVRPGGIVLFARNLDGATQAQGLIAELRDLLGAATHIAIDQEGGRVVRFTRDLTVFPGNAALGAVAERDLPGAIALARRQGELGGRELRAVGVDVNFAPVADLSARADNPVVADRSFGRDPQCVAALVAAFVEGQRAAGVRTTLKHFPGLGGARVDPHVELPQIDGPFESSALAPFRAGLAAGAELVMTTHVCFPAIDVVPVTFSASVVRDRLRGRLGFRGVVVSDALEMAGVARHFGLAEIIQRTAAAGHDVLCLGSDDATLQEQAHAVLTDGYRAAAEWVGDVPATDARLDTLARRAMGSPLEAGGADSRAAGAVELADAQFEPGRALAAEIAWRALRVVDDPLGLLPLRPNAGDTDPSKSRRPVVALPCLAARTLAEDRLRGERLEVLREGLGSAATIADYDSEPGPADVVALARLAIDTEVLVLVSFDVRFSPARRALAQHALQWNPRVVFVLLSDLHDLGALPAGHRATTVVAHGFRRVHQVAVLRALLGEPGS
ncbi:MAG: beta-N-acetylhexosaminidase [Planctomycetota bacterium]